MLPIVFVIDRENNTIQPVMRSGAIELIGSPCADQFQLELTVTSMVNWLIENEMANGQKQFVSVAI